MDKYLRQLEQILQAHLEANDELLTLLKRKREALSQADHQVVSHLCALENEKLRAITELEKQRLLMVGEITSLIQPQATEPMHLLAIADRLTEPARGRLLVLRSELRDKIQQVQSETQITRRVTEAIYQHMQGMLQTIGAACTGVMTYGRQGMRPKTATAVSTFSATA